MNLHTEKVSTLKNHTQINTLNGTSCADSSCAASAEWASSFHWCCDANKSPLEEIFCRIFPHWNPPFPTEESRPSGPQLRPLFAQSSCCQPAWVATSPCTPRRWDETRERGGKSGCDTLGQRECVRESGKEEGKKSVSEWVSVCVCVLLRVRESDRWSTALANGDLSHRYPPFSWIHPDSQVL